MRHLLQSIIIVAAIVCTGCAQESSEPAPERSTVEVTTTVDSLAEVLLDSTRSDEDREAVVSDHPDEAVALVKALTDDLSPGTEEEYSRIPWIWRVSIALGERNNAREIRQLLDVSLPGANDPLREWQSVVIGGGIINGISRQDGWPKQRIETVIGDNRMLKSRWDRAIDLSAKMADNEAVDNPYRYDALRMIAMKSWEEASDQLVKYLSREYDSELQMGAISGLSDMRAPRVADVLIDHFDQYTTERNRNLTLDALMRTPGRMKTVLDAVARGDIPSEALGEKRTALLKNTSNAEIRARAAEVLSE
jgi:hypothetical protein